MGSLVGVCTCIHTVVRRLVPPVGRESRVDLVLDASITRGEHVDRRGPHGWVGLST